MHPLFGLCTLCLLLVSCALAPGLKMLVARSREDYCSLLDRLARNSEKVADESLSFAANARQKLLATLKSHAVWNVDAQANTFLVRFSSECCTIRWRSPAALLAASLHSQILQVALKMLHEAREISSSSHLLSARISPAT